MEKENWVKAINKKYDTSGFDRKLEIIEMFKDKVIKKYRVKKTKDSERWAYGEKTFGYLYDTYCDGKTYRLDLETGEISIEK